MSQDRVQKLLARAGVASRRKAEELIEQGRVTVNGEIAMLGDKADPATDTIKVDSKQVKPRSSFQYLLLHKPPGVMSTRSDPEGRPTVLELIPPKFRKTVVPVGRLDFQTEGLLLLTDDGDLAHRVAHPRFGCHKVYEVKVKGTPAMEKIEKIRRRGVVIDGRRVIPRRVEPLVVGGHRDAARNSWWTVEVAEGRTRQIREMFFRIGHPVQRLRRVAIGPVSDAKLTPGASRELTEREVAALRKVSTPKRRPRGPKPARAKPAGQAKKGS